MDCHNFSIAEISFLIIYSTFIFVKIILRIFPEIFGDAKTARWFV